MLQIGILSDTHGFVHTRVIEFFENVDEIWHSGDFGDVKVANQLKVLKPLKAVYGNIDGNDLRIEYPEVQLFQIEKVKVLMTHIGGYPGRYDHKVRLLIEQEKPKLFVCGHSHILKVIYDKKYDLLHINPGAAGKYGIHKSITAVRLIIDHGNMRNLEILDIPRK
ncbi:MAG: metallophosphoesterase family protein [Bacteroidales bacterium]|nr:metallophosphoesterase family protein [Bacteroidales bacterium]